MYRISNSVYTFSIKLNNLKIYEFIRIIKSIQLLLPATLNKWNCIGPKQQYTIKTISLKIKLRLLRKREQFNRIFLRLEFFMFRTTKLDQRNILKLVEIIKKYRDCSILLACLHDNRPSTVYSV